MRPTNYLPAPALLLSTLGSLSIFAAPAMAQNKGDTSSSSDTKPSSSDSKATPSDTPTPSPASKTSQSSQKSTSSDKPSSSPTGGSSSSATATTKVSITNTGSPVTTDSKTIASITGGPQATTGGELTGFPTLTRGGIPTYPPPTVPPTNNAPFMHQSSMPDGTVFIAVGAILGAFGLAILLWRGIVSLLLHRSVERAAMAQNTANNKAAFPAPPAPFYKYTDQESAKSVGGGAAAAGRGVRRTNRAPVPSSTPSHSNLFFSPTAVNNNAAGARGSAFLPSGFYASGSGAPAPSQTNSISLNNLRPDSRGHYTNASRHTLSQTPPDSPQYPARRDVSAMSTSSLNLSSLSPGQRAPSAYLEDLLADDPGALPPSQMPPSAGPRNSANLGGRMTSPQNRL
ncbi:Uncharacterized protein TPAR_02757 [Tolypocladium paradoxum]|uniref:CSI2 protein n=1 Tax=Tolypocladium paradoxum TaxID=94208 RepID=A0A2S4L3P9_9HYPO|nr:Uncharacterized protein TPAR_02757 [Tolypocladium paradoxum]